MLPTVIVVVEIPMIILSLQNYIMFTVYWQENTLMLHCSETLTLSNYTIYCIVSSPTRRSTVYVRLNKHIPYMVTSTLHKLSS